MTKNLFSLILICLLCCACSTVKSQPVKKYQFENCLKFSIGLSKEETAEVPEQSLRQIKRQLEEDLYNKNFLTVEKNDDFCSAEISLYDYRMRSNFARWMFGIFTGCDYIKSRVSVSDSTTQQNIAENQITLLHCGYSTKVLFSEYQIKKHYCEGIVDYLTGKQ